MRYYLIAGEPSGDLHASNLMRELAALDAEAEFRFWGGDLMEAVGGTLVRHYKETAVMGVVDVITHLGKIMRNFRECRADILNYRPDALILVDYPGFNLKMAEFAHKHRIKVLYYISPKVWASKEYRIKLMRKNIDRLYSILPFEVPYFRSKSVDAIYCGNPVMDAISQRANVGEEFHSFCKRNNLDERPKIALIAGSRKAELRYCLPEMLKAIKEFPEFQFVIAGAPSFTMADYSEYIEGYDVEVVFGQTYQLMSQARAALVTSGTATLETAILNCPQVIIYLMWGGRLSDFVAHLFIKVKWIGLVNLILGRDSIDELFQCKYYYQKMIDDLRSLVDDSPERTQMLQDYDELRRIVGGPGCSSRAASDMIDFLKR